MVESMKKNMEKLQINRIEIQRLCHKLVVVIQVVIGMLGAVPPNASAAFKASEY